MKFRVGHYVYLNPRTTGRLDLNLGIVKSVKEHPHFPDTQLVTVEWMNGLEDDQPWRGHWLELV